MENALHFYSCEYLCREGASIFLCLEARNAVKTALINLVAYCEI